MSIGVIAIAISEYERLRAQDKEKQALYEQLRHAVNTGDAPMGPAGLVDTQIPPSLNGRPFSTLEAAVAVMGPQP